MNIPVAHSSDAIINFFKVVGEDTPWVVDNEFLISKGFKSGNHKEIRGIFRGLHFLDTTNMPTRRWHEYKDNPSDVLKIALNDGYDELFAVFPDAPLRDKSELVTWFREHKDYSQITAIRAVRIFKRLCDFANITGDSPQAPATEEAPKPDLPNDAERQLTAGILKVTDDFLKAILKQAVEEDIITHRQSKDLFAMHINQGLWKISKRKGDLDAEKT